ncbi:hypothetical protein [Bartonella sp. DGB2]|uniref:hypothetical protein n=1 Tax=Bartonella sp. DGB2 TaxID=3388426 RepID=UPI00398FBDD7
MRWQKAFILPPNLYAHGDKQIYNRSVSENKLSLAALDAEIAQLEGRPKARLFYIAAGRGY